MRRELEKRLQRLETRLGPPEPAFPIADLIDALAVFAGDWQPGENELDAFARALGLSDWAEYQACYGSVGHGRDLEDFSRRFQRALAALARHEYGTGDPDKISVADLERLAERARSIMADQKALA